VLGAPHHAARVQLVRLEQRADVDARWHRGGRYEIVDMLPILGPEVPQEVRRDQPVRCHHARPVLLDQARADVGVELEIERPELLPQPVHFPGEGVGWHVVVLTPQRADVGEAEVPRPPVRQSDKPRVAVPHAHRDGVPAAPHVGQLHRVAARGHDPLDVRDFEALPRGAAIAPFAVVGVHAARDAAQFGGFSGVGRRGRDERPLQQQELAAQLGGERHGVIAPSTDREVPRCHVVDRIREGGELLGVERDVGLGHPARAGPCDAEVVQGGLGAHHERCGVRDRGADGARASRLRGSRRRDAHEEPPGNERHDATHQRLHG
jgi:hypothetical protein